MNRRQLLLSSAALGLSPLAVSAHRSSMAFGGVTSEEAHAPTLAGGTHSSPQGGAGAEAVASLPVPPEGSIPVAVVLSDRAVVIDFSGPWEVFESVRVAGRPHSAFSLYTVAQTTDPLTASGGLKIVPNFSFESAPLPKVVVIPAQRGAGQAALDWIRRVTRDTDVTMSVCTGAYVLAQTGLLSGKAATTHHSSYSDFALQFPDIRLVRGARFVETGNVATSGGLTSGIDLSLRVVERYFGREIATQTAYYMEYQGQGWMDPDSNRVYRTGQASTAAHPLCPVCAMEVDPATAPQSVYRGMTYYFCTPGHKALFEKAPATFLQVSES